MLLIALVSGVLAGEPSRVTSGPQGVRPLGTMLSTCGLRRQDYGSVWDQTLQDEVITIRLPNDRLSDSSLACMAHVSFLISATYVFRAPEAQRRFEAAKKASPEAAAILSEYREQARHWLDERKLLEGALAIRDQAGTLNDRATHVELYSGFSPESVLEVKNGKVYVRPRPGLKVTYDNMAMLLNVLAVAMPECAVAIVTEEAAAEKSAAP